MCWKTQLLKVNSHKLYPPDTHYYWGVDLNKHRLSIGIIPEIITFDLMLKLSNTIATESASHTIPYAYYYYNL